MPHPVSNNSINSAGGEHSRILDENMIDLNVQLNQLQQYQQKQAPNSNLLINPSSSSSSLASPPISSSSSSSNNEHQQMQQSNAKSSKQQQQPIKSAENGYSTNSNNTSLKQKHNNQSSGNNGNSPNLSKHSTSTPKKNQASSNSSPAQKNKANYPPTNSKQAQNVNNEVRAAANSPPGDDLTSESDEIKVYDDENNNPDALTEEKIDIIEEKPVAPISSALAFSVNSMLFNNDAVAPVVSNGLVPPTAAPNPFALANTTGTPHDPFSFFSNHRSAEMAHFAAWWPLAAASMVSAAARFTPTAAQAFQYAAAASYSMQQQQQYAAAAAFSRGFSPSLFMPNCGMAAAAAAAAVQHSSSSTSSTSSMGSSSAESPFSAGSIGSNRGASSHHSSSKLNNSQGFSDKKNHQNHSAASAVQHNNRNQSQNGHHNLNNSKSSKPSKQLNHGINGNNSMISHHQDDPFQTPMGLHQQNSPHSGAHGLQHYQQHHQAHAPPPPHMPAKPKKPVVKKPLNAFMLFMKEQRAQVVSECTLRESAAINQILGRKWHELDKSEQAKYYEKAKQERLNHLQLYPGWSARDNYGLKKKRRRKREKLVDENGNGNSDLPRKCRARFGISQFNLWCKPCRRKKKCIRFANEELDGSNGGQMVGANGQLYSPGSAMFSNGNMGENGGGSMNGGNSEDDYEHYDDDTDEEGNGEDDDDENESDVSSDNEEDSHRQSSLHKLEMSRKSGGGGAPPNGFHAHSPLPDTSRVGNGGPTLNHQHFHHHHSMGHHHQHPNKKPNLGQFENVGKSEMVDSKHGLMEQIQQMQQQMHNHQ